MTREEYEARRQRLEDERQAAVDLVEAAHRAQVRALELVWMTESGEPAAGPLPAAPRPAQETPPSPAAPPPLPARQRTPDETYDDLHAALPRLPQPFDRRDICRALGYVPERNRLHRFLKEMVAAGILVVKQRAEGRVPGKYALAASSSIEASDGQAQDG